MAYKDKYWMVEEEWQKINNEEGQSYGQLMYRSNKMVMQSCILYYSSQVFYLT